MKYIYVVLGFILLGIGTVGAFLPILPTVPFLLAASFCFTKGSRRFEKFFHSTDIYKKHIESFEKSRAMTFKTKAKTLSFASAMLLIAFMMMNNIYGRATIIILVIIKYYYFIFKVKTIDCSDSERRK